MAGLRGQVDQVVVDFLEVDFFRHVESNDG